MSYIWTYRFQASKQYGFWPTDFCTLHLLFLYKTQAKCWHCTRFQPTEDENRSFDPHTHQLGVSVGVPSTTSIGLHICGLHIRSSKMYIINQHTMMSKSWIIKHRLIILFQLLISDEQFDDLVEYNNFYSEWKQHLKCNIYYHTRWSFSGGHVYHTFHLLHRIPWECSIIRYMDATAHETFFWLLSSYTSLGGLGIPVFASSVWIACGMGHQHSQLPGALWIVYSCISCGAVSFAITCSRFHSGTVHFCMSSF